MFPLNENYIISDNDETKALKTAQEKFCHIVKRSVSFIRSLSERTIKFIKSAKEIRP